jgi:uncharacterized protein YwgA
VDISRREIAMLVVASSGKEGLSPVQLQKSLFLVAEYGSGNLPADFYQFSPYNYGPFSAEIYDDTDELTREGLVIGIDSGFGWSRYVASPAGMKRSEEVKEKMVTVLCDYISNVVEWVQSLDFAGLLRAIYAKYPQYRVNSIFQG